MEIKVKRHYKIDTFNKFSLLLRYDSVASAFNFQMYFDPNDSKHRMLFQPGHYHELDVIHNNELLVRGWILSQGFGVGPDKVLSSVNGYSLPGVLEDCNIPIDLYPLQSDQKTLREIAQRLVSKFPFGIVVDPSVASLMDQKFDTSTASESQSIKAYLNELASQKNIILTHTADGNLLFTKPKTRRSPIFHFENNQPSIEMSLQFNGQGMHSHIWVQKEADIEGGNAGQELKRNPFVPYVFRPSVKTQSSGDDVNTAEAAQNALQSELKNIVLTIKTNMWEIDGKVIKPNNIITVRNPELYLFETSNWFIESVQLDGDETETVATLTCVLPEVYNGNIPPYIFEVNEEKLHSS